MKWQKIVKKVPKPYSIIEDKNQTKKYKKKAKKFNKKYGFNFEETWSLDHSFACWIVPRLAFLRDNHCGYPSCLITERDENGHPTNDEGNQKWIAVLDEMIEGFSIYAEDCRPVEEDKIAKVDRALELFKEYFYGLWD